jgi:hypothetical protein
MWLSMVKERAINFDVFEEKTSHALIERLAVTFSIVND